MDSIVECGGFQYSVREGDVISVPLVDAQKDDEITLDRVLMTRDGETTVVGTPTVDGIVVKATVVEHGKGKKVLVMKKKRRKDYLRKNGHRQPFTRIRITSIGA